MPDARTAAVAAASLAAVSLLAAALLSRRRGAPTCRAAWLRGGRRGPGARVVLVATGSVASVKVPELVVELCREVAAEVAVVLTAPGEATALGLGQGSEVVPIHSRLVACV